MADNKILVFGENVASEDYLSDAEYSTNEIRNTGNVVGLARRKPNNKALKQATLMASALAQALADNDGEWTGTEINDSLTPAGIKGIFKNYLETKIDSFTKAISLFSNSRYEYDEDTDYLPTDARTYNGELYICKQANGPTSPNIVVHPDSITPNGKDYWMKVGEGGTSYEIGQRVESLIPLTNAMLHPTDGALISGSGSYAEFVAIMAQKVSTNPELFVTEADWQQSVTDYGECGKFVYDNVANTIRLPLLNGYTKATNTASEVGDLVEAAAPNINGLVYMFRDTASSAVASGAFSWGTQRRSNQAFFANTNNAPITDLIFNANDSNPIYKDSATTIDVQAIKVYSYIVLGTVTKTDIQIDIDNILSDLNLKADKDLTNLNNTGKANIVNHFANSGTAERIEVIHNGIFRGENLLDYFDSKDDIYTAVAAGDFTNIYIGDYIEDTFTYGGTQYTTKFRVAGINSYYNYGDTALTQYHLVMVPDNTITEQMNTSNTTSGGYVGSRMYTTVLPALLAALAGTSGTPFYGHVISHRELFVNTVSNGVSSSWDWYDNSICLMSEQEIYGHAAWGSSGCDRGYANAQLPLFKLAPKYIATFNRTWHWLRSVHSATPFCVAHHLGDANSTGASSTHGVRPRFLIG